MDPEGGDQPLYNEDQTKAIVANGAIYNFHSLRKQLSAEHTFRTGNDSEAIVHLYEDHEQTVVDHLDGMFAFAIANGENLFAARDPIGIKPLYYGVKGDNFYFASELKAFPGQIEMVHEFPPGTWYHSDEGFVSFYEIPDHSPVEISLDFRLSSLRATLEKSVTKRLMSDVPLGTFLSGGLDSSIIAAIARQHIDELHSFSVGIEGSRDLEAARVVARYLDTVHHEYIFRPKEVLEILPDVIYHLESFDQDLVRSAIPCYFVSRLASEKVKVILTGEGADELFAGYTYYKNIFDNETLHRELRRSVACLHNINLQRVDRLTMAHGLEGRVPFLDLEMINLSQTIGPSLKLSDDGKGRKIEKWILRKATEDLLPQEIVWRDKAQFDEGSGTVDLLQSAIAEKMTPTAADEYRVAHPEIRLRSPEECFYHRIFTEVFEFSELISANVGRWAERPALE
jgi:asparagine synthase (glutamine-hydrolysing)